MTQNWTPKTSTKQQNTLGFLKQHPSTTESNLKCRFSIWVYALKPLLGEKEEELLHPFTHFEVSKSVLLCLLTNRNNDIQLEVCLVRLSLISDAQITLRETFPSTIIHRIGFSLPPGVHL